MASVVIEYAHCKLTVKDVQDYSIDEDFVYIKSIKYAKWIPTKKVEEITWYG